MKMKIIATKATVTITTTINNKTIISIYHEGYLLKNEKKRACASASACPYERTPTSECEESLYTMVARERMYASESTRASACACASQSTCPSVRASARDASELTSALEAEI